MKAVVRHAGFFDVEDRLRELSSKGDDLERVAVLVDFTLFRPELERAVPRADGTKGGRPAFDHVLMFKILLMQSIHGLCLAHPPQKAAGAAAAADAASDAASQCS